MCCRRSIQERILREEFLLPLDMTPYALAKHLHVPRTRIERIVAEKIDISADTALRLGKFFKTTPQFWLNMQTSYDLKIHSSCYQGGTRRESKNSKLPSAAPAT